MSLKRLVGLDVGEKRIGVAVADNEVCIAIPFDTIEVDGNEYDAITDLVQDQKADILVIGYPRNQSGEPTAQTDYVESFAEKITDIGVKVVYQDESLTSVTAEQQLISYKKPYSKGDIDALAAALILQDYIEENYEKK